MLVSNYGTRYGNMARFFMPTNTQTARAAIARIDSHEMLEKYDERMTRLYECGALSVREFMVIVGLIADQFVAIDLASYD